MRFLSEHPILVIEDDEDIRESLVEILESDGFLVKSVGDGPTALELLQGGLLPCWILLDIAMPGMSGFECLDKIRENPEWTKIPVTLLSAAADVKFQAETKNVDYLKKPVEIDDLFAKAEKHGCRRTL